MNDIISSIVFYAIALAIIITSLGVVISKNLVHSALLMTACFVAVGILYITLSADFLGAMEFMLYSGGVAVLVVMGVMLTHRGEGMPSNPSHKGKLLGAIIAMAFLLIMVGMVTFIPAGGQGFVADDTVAGIADMMLNVYILPFEIAAVLLLAALVGAIILAKGDGEA